MQYLQLEHDSAIRVKLPNRSETILVFFTTDIVTDILFTATKISNDISLSFCHGRTVLIAALGQPLTCS